ncbi:MAG: sodium-dependent transporter [Bacillota bacterium]|nr:sodium-dependent transporter [Bacillota bacterium]
MKQNRDVFKTTWGFIWASIGSAVGCGNIWRFPVMVSKYGGLTYIIPYLIFVVLVANSGIIEEFALGRAAKSGPIGAFGLCTEKRGWGRRFGNMVGVVPVLGSLGLAIGYTCVFGWIIKYAYMAISGKLYALGTDLDTLGYSFGVETASAGSNNMWIIIAVVVALAITAFGVSSGIEKVNKFMMPLLFGMLVVLAIYISTLPGASEGYKYILTINPAGLADPNTWIYAFGMAFFSLSVAGNGSVIYGSYLERNEDIPFSAARVAIFDTIASLLATFVILPAMAAGGVSCDSSGPGLIFIYLVNVFNGMAVGRIIGVVFFILFVFAALSSIINLYEVSVAFVQDFFRAKRAIAAFFALGIGCFVAIFIQGIASEWMDVVNNFICPIGALLAAIMFFWVAGKDFALKEVNEGAKIPVGNAFIFLGKYVFCACAIVALVAGAILGGIG